MLRSLPLLLLLFAACEIASIIWVGQAVGVFMTLLLLLGNIFAGLALLRSAGMNMLAAMRSPLDHFTPAQNAANSAVFRVLSGLVFLIPGFFSDFLALLLLWRPVQSWISSKFQNKRFQGTASRAPSRFSMVIEGEAVEIDGHEPPAGRGQRDN